MRTLLSDDPLICPKSTKTLYFLCSMKIITEITNVKLLYCHLSGNLSESFSDEVTKVLLKSWKKNAKQCYGNKINLWTACYAQSVIECIWLRVNVLGFLHLLEGKRLSYGNINSSKSLLFVVNTLDGMQLVRYPLVNRSMKDLHSISSILLKHSFIRNAFIEIKCLSEVPNISKEESSGKLNTLLTILCGETARDINQLWTEEMVYKMVYI